MKAQLRVFCAAVTCSVLLATGQQPGVAQRVPAPSSSAWENPWLTFIGDHNQQLRGYLDAVGGLAMTALVLTSLASLAGLVPGVKTGSSTPNASSIPLGRPFDSLPHNPAETYAHKFTVTVNGTQRVAYAAVGKNYQPGTPAPLMLVFHGKGGAGVDMSMHSGFPATGAGRDAISVYAQANTKDQAWEGAPYSVDHTGNDIAYVKEVLRFIQQEYTIDRTRIYATGLSNGGGMAGLLSCQTPGVFAAIATVAAPFYNGTKVPCENQPPIPVLIIHGAKDTVIALNGGQKWGETYPSAHDVHRGFARRNGCNGGQDTDSAGSITTLSYPHCAAETTLMVDNQGGHDWSMEGLSTATTVWDFLARQRKERETDL